MIDKEAIIFVKGSNDILFSAPHSCKHKRGNFYKAEEVNTDLLIKEVKKNTDCHIVYLNKKVSYDPNYNYENEYKKKLVKYIEKNNIKYVVDLHGMKNIGRYDLEIGTNHLKNLNDDEMLFAGIIENIKNSDCKLKVDKNFKATKRTVSAYLNKMTKIPTLQLELSKNMRTNNFEKSLDMLTNLSEYLINQSSLVINYQEKYDKVLDIKPSYNYKRELGKIPYNYIGLEIEVAVNYERDSYSFIRKLLIKIKNIVGDNGYFVKDNTIKSSYNFEIVLDPLPVHKIIEIYEKIYEILKFSNGLLETTKERNCGLHANFNKFDVTDLFVSHKNLINLLLNNKMYFDTNRYKQEKLISNYEKYCEYQEEIGGKYLWINYQKEKIIEVRNILAGLNPNSLENILNYLLAALYYDKDLASTEFEKSIDVDLIHELLNTNFIKLKKNKKIVIKLDKYNNIVVK